MSDFHTRELEVFAEILRLPARERPAFLDRVCLGDAEFRRQVETLLAAHDRAGDFLEQCPADEARGGARVGEKPGDVIGRYKLLQQIGEGGCGVVYLAEQSEPVRRRVALKIIKPGMDTKSVIARFEAERQVLALMDHAGIAKVFDAGATDSGRPYFVMELVRGIKITDYCDQNALGTRERLTLFIHVCQAVQHAHQKGIIHRDLKPSNILVATSTEGLPSPVIIDFGIAKATTNQQLTDKTLFTAFEMLIGTPAYMSPEQAALTSADIDTRSDIYSLGVLLYELLTGSPPFDARELMKSGLNEIRRVISEQEPVRPSTRLGKMRPVELTSVCQCRCAEPPALIRAIRGDLDWVVMKALEKDRTRRYETANGLALDVQRYLANEAITARPPSKIYKFRKLVLRNKLLFGGITVIALLLLASLAVVSASLAKERTEANERRRVTLFLADMLRGVGPSVARGRDTTILKEILNQTADRLGKELATQPAVEAELRSLIGQIYQELEELREAEKMYRAALALNQKLYGSQSQEAAASLNALGSVLGREGRLTEAEAAQTQALNMRRKLFGNMNGDVAASLNNLAVVCRLEGKLPQAEALIRDSLAIRRKIYGEQSLQTVDSLRNLSILLGDEGKRPEAEATAREVLTARRRVLGGDDPLVAGALDDVAWAAGFNGKVDEAQSLESASLALKRKVLGDEHPAVARSLYLLGSRLQQRGQLTESDALVAAALSIQRKLLGEDNPDTLSTLVNLSSTLEGEGKWAEAEMTDREALAALRRRMGNESPQTLEAVKSLARVLVDQNKLGDAEQLLNETLTPDFVRQAASLDLLMLRVNILGRQGRWPEAAADAMLACALKPTDHYDYHILAVLLGVTGNRPAYKQLCQTLLMIYSQTSNPYIAERVVKDCLLFPDSGTDLQRVDKLADSAVELGKTDPSGMVWFQTAKALSEYRLGRFAQAAAWAEKTPKDAQIQAQDYSYGVLAMARWQLGQKDEARAALAKGNSLLAYTSSGNERLPLGEWWVAWIQARITLDEAAALIGPVTAADHPAKKPLRNASPLAQP